MHRQEFQTEVSFCDICGAKKTFNEDTGRRTGCGCETGLIDPELFIDAQTDTKFTFFDEKEVCDFIENLPVKEEENA